MSTHAMNIGKIYEAAEKIARMKRKAQRLHIARVCKQNPYLNPYDLRDIIALYEHSQRKD